MALKRATSTRSRPSRRGTRHSLTLGGTSGVPRIDAIAMLATLVQKAVRVHLPEAQIPCRGGSARRSSQKTTLSGSSGD